MTHPLYDLAPESGSMNLPVPGQIEIVNEALQLVEEALKRTPFESALEAHKNGTLKVPTVSSGTSEIPYFSYQLITHKFTLRTMAQGMHFRGISFKQIKDYYGLKARTKKEAFDEFCVLYNKYFATLQPPANS